MAHPTHQSTISYLLHNKKSKKTVIYMTYIIGVVGNIAVIPQIIKAWQTKAPGLAVSTWIMFVIFGLIWLIYAIQNKQKPLIVAQVVGLTCNIGVVAGWIFNNIIR
ncbi:MAG: hypothetical protein WCP00_02425 [bacterium]|jgi:hypothetical protein